MADKEMEPRRRGSQRSLSRSSSTTSVGSVLSRELSTENRSSVSERRKSATKILEQSESTSQGQNDSDRSSDEKAPSVLSLQAQSLVEALKSKLEDRKLKGAALTPLRLSKSPNVEVNVVYEIPYMNSRYAANFFYLLGFLYLVIGGGLLFANRNLKYVKIDYTRVTQNGTNRTCESRVVAGRINMNTNCPATVTFEIRENISGPVYLYYGLEPFYHGHRRLFDMMDRYQILGNPVGPSSNCKEFAKVNSSIEVAPCGPLADAMFNDSFALELRQQSTNSSSWRRVHILFTDIACRECRRSFRNPPNNGLKVAFQNTTKPRNWRKRIEDIGESPGEAGGYENERFINWMDNAPLPLTIKMYARIDPGYFGGSLFAGKYRLLINYNYPLWRRAARKYFILANTSFFGHQNYTLSFYFIYVGVVSLFIALVLNGIYMVYDIPTMKFMRSLGVKIKFSRGLTFHRKIE